MKLAWQAFQIFLTVGLCILILTSSTLPPVESALQARGYTRTIEFDYVSWTVDALLLKIGQASLSTPRYLTTAEQSQTVKNYIKLVQQIDEADYQVELVYADPKITDKNSALKPWQDKLSALRDQRNVLGPVAEEIIQNQVSDVLVRLGLGIGGQPVPPVLFHTTPLPYALIISPRNVIRQDDDISLDPSLTLDQMVLLENQVEKSLHVSALVTPIGGIGIYPTMVMSTSDLPWLGEVVSHEWTHNYLTLRPLGLNYYTSEQLRTMNETTANIVGHEVSQELLRLYYPEYLPKPAPTPAPTPQGQPTPAPTPPEPPQFNFNKVMHLTRVTTDQMLKEGKVDEAEAYMETQRKIFWDNGYLIRKLNQAYFAFNGAYADNPGGGAAGADPVGPAVQQLRQQSKSLADFLHRISQISTFAQLQHLIEIDQSTS
jgi:hypothetical protein